MFSKQILMCPFSDQSKRKNMKQTYILTNHLKQTTRNEIKEILVKKILLIIIYYDNALSESFRKKLLYLIITIVIKQ